MEYFSITLREYKDGNFVGHVQIGTDIKYIDDKRVYIHDLYVANKPIFKKAKIYFVS